MYTEAKNVPMNFHTTALICRASLLGRKIIGDQESAALLSTGERWMKHVKEATHIPEDMLSLELFVPDIFGKGTLVTRSDGPNFASPLSFALSIECSVSSSLSAKRGTL